MKPPDKEWIDKYFWTKVDKKGDCWIWRGAKNTHGYGNIGYRNCKTLGAHRLIKAVDDGIDPFKIGRKKYACHSCDNRLCVRPSHIFWGTHSDNMKDAAKKKRLYWQKTDASRGANHGMSKILPEDANEIIKLYRGGTRVRDLMKKYNLADTTIYNIIHGKLWNHATHIK